jgi:hypothetical protein
MRRIGIVALARRLLIALWRYLEDGCQGAFKFPQLWALKIPHPG